LTREPIESEFKVRSKVSQAEDARNVWKQVFRELAKNGSTKSKAERIENAFFDFDLIRAVITQYITNFATALTAPQIDDIGQAIVTASKKITEAQKGLGNISSGLFGAPNTEGEAFQELALWANDSLIDAMRKIGEAKEMVAAMGQTSPGKRGRGGIRGQMFKTPKETLALYLGRLWHLHGLSLAGGTTGDGLDDVIALIVEIIEKEPDRGPRKWLKNLMEKVRKAAEDNFTEISAPHNWPDFSAI